MNWRKVVKKITAVIMAMTLMFGSSLLASAEAGNDGVQGCASFEADKWCSLKEIEPLKAGETGTVNLVAEKTVYLNAVTIYIKINDDKAEFASEKKEDGTYDFFATNFWGGVSSGVSNYVAETKEVKMAAACAENDKLMKIEPGMVIASFKIKAKSDLTVGDVVATLTYDLLTDLVQELRYNGDERNIDDCIIKEKPVPWCSLEEIEAIKAGETTTVNLVADKTVYLSAVEIAIKVNDEKVEFASEKNESYSYNFFTRNFFGERGIGVCNYLEEEKEVKMVGAGGNANELVKITPGTIIGSFKIKAKADLVAGDVVAALIKIDLTDEVQETDFSEGEGDFGSCIVKESEPDCDYDATENPIISKDELQDILDENKVKDIIIKTINDIIFTFIQGTMEAVDGMENYDFGTIVNNDFTNLELPASVTEENFVSKITYNYSGELPAEAFIKIFVGKNYAEKWLVYSLLEDNTLSERQNIKADSEGYIMVKQNHCSSYVITLAKNQSVGDMLMGDINGDGSITAEDALDVLKNVVGLKKLAGDDLTCADVNADNAITAEDALDVLKNVVGLLDKFNAEQE